MAADLFLSCDWGTTAFRLRVIQLPELTILAEETSKQGIADTFALWQQQPEKNRFTFYTTILQQHIQALEQKLHIALPHIPIIISGMASSTIGMIDLPYKDMPVATDGSNLFVHTIPASESFLHEVMMISGIKTDSDVMRGEETKIIGAIDADNNNEAQILIFPGTHSKHVQVKGNTAVDFHTYMTGEFFALLTQKSVLAASVAEGGHFDLPGNIKSFKKGVSDSRQQNLLHSCFEVRVNNLFDRYTKQQSYYYLSGLLIGTEVKELLPADRAKITVVINDVLRPYYQMAFEVLGLSPQTVIKSADKALIKGQYIIYRQLKIETDSSKSW